MAIVSQILNPGIVQAQGINTDLATSSPVETVDLAKLTIDQSPVGHLFYDHQNYPQPDKIVKGIITEYSSTVDQCDEDPFIAAWGDRVFDGMIAANWLPRGAKIKIPSLFGDKVFTVADHMNSRYGYGRLDVWIDGTRRQADGFGVQRAEVEVYYPDNEFSQNHNKQIGFKMR